MTPLILIVITIFILVYQFSKYLDKLEELEELEKENQILKTENYSLKRVMRENDLIPEEYVKQENK